ncbi:MAG TPA: MFS transporter [Candidatus Pacearchaeota archaeon]|nr:MFS transporter [Candidatus Pacearchaeota archaeon]HOK94223.1 MFS transporter [Candidatus Pacearchaeota archaeon]HPO75393.1 MFS transporter [Candidatus Pacearchaeota archaeon]
MENNKKEERNNNSKFNKIIKYLVLSDLIFWSGWGLVNPIFAIFITDNIEGGNALVVGIASGVYWLLKSILMIPIGTFLDNRPGEKDDYWVLVSGFFIAALVPFGFIFAKLPWHIYLLQAIQAVGMAASLSAWSAIFTRHIDKGKEATEWSLDATAVGLGTGISGTIGGWAVTKFGFNPVFIAVGILGIIGTLLLLSLRRHMRAKRDHGLYFSLRDIFQRLDEK